MGITAKHKILHVLETRRTRASFGKDNRVVALTKAFFPELLHA